MVWSYGFFRGMHALRLHWQASLNTVLTLAGTLALLAVLSLAAMNFVRLAGVWLHSANFSLFLDAELSSAERTQLLEQVRQHPLVVRVELISPQRGLERLAQSLGADLVLLAGEEGILPAVIDSEVRVEHEEQIAILMDYFRDLPGVEDVVHASLWLGEAQLFFFTLRFLGYSFAALSLVAYFLTLFNAMRLSLYARLRELEILDLVGASRWIIRSSFLVEGMLLSILGCVLALGIAWGVFQAISYTLRYGRFTKDWPEQLMFFEWPISLVAVLGACLLGMVSSWLAVNGVLRRFNP